MKIISKSTLSDGGERITLRLAPNEKIVVVSEKGYYQLGYPLDDLIVGGDKIAEARPVVWDVIEQKWMT